MTSREPNNYAVCFRQGDSGLSRQLVSGRDFRLAEWSLCEYANGLLPRRIADLLRVAMSVYTVDRLVRRPRGSADDGWPRTIEITVEVAEPDFWNRAEVRDILAEAVGNLLADDVWDFQFQGLSGCQYRQEWFDFSLPDRPTVCLYSGGLDSAAGLALRSQELKTVNPVTVWHQPGQRRLVNEQLQSLGQRYGVILRPAIIKAALLKPPRFRYQETTQRCRCFLFTAVGGAVALLLGGSSLEVYESGIGAVDLPLMCGMVGSKASKGCHPRFLRLMSRLLSLVAEREIVIHLPFLWNTKAEVVKTLIEDGLGGLAGATVSCAHYPLHESRKHCGVCSNCILRRQALLVAGFQEHGQIYKYDLFGQAEATTQIPDDQLTCLKAVLLRVDELSRLEHGHELPGFFVRHLRGTGIVSNGESLEPFVELFRRYRQEWLGVVELGQRAGWPWAKWLSFQKAA